MYLARNADDSLNLFTSKPKLVSKGKYECSDLGCITDIFPDVTFDGGPVEVNVDGESGWHKCVKGDMPEDSDFQPKAEKPVYYRGDTQRGKEIIAALEELGGKNPSGFEGFNKENVYYIDQFGLIRSILYKCVKDYIDKFTELHLPPKKVKKEGWMNLFRNKPDQIYWSEGVYDSESEAKLAAKSTLDELTGNIEVLKTYKIDWEEEEK